MKIKTIRKIKQATEVFDITVANNHNYYAEGCLVHNCHEKSTKRGLHASHKELVDLINQFHSGAELAIGGGNPLSYPLLEDLLVGAAEKGLICNLTVNQFHINQYGQVLNDFRKRRLIWGVGISLNDKVKEPIDERYLDGNTIYHCIAGIHDPFELMNLPKGSKLLILGYKTHGFGIKYAQTNDVAPKIRLFEQMLPYLSNRFHLCFDNNAVVQLKMQEKLSPEMWEKYYMGDDGTHTMYIDAVTMSYAPSSTQSKRPIGNMTLHEMFHDVRTNKQHSLEVLTGG